MNSYVSIKLFIFFFVNLLFILGFIWLFFRIIRRGITEGKKEKEAAEKLLIYFPGSISKFLPCINLTYRGLKFKILLGSGSEGASPCLVISLLKSSAFKLKLMKESLLRKSDKVALTIYQKELKLNDQMFDEEFLILSNQPDRVVSYFSNGEMKNAVRDLFGLGFTYFAIGKRKMSISKPNYKVEIDLKPQQVTNVFQKLSILARAA